MIADYPVHVRVPHQLGTAIKNARTRKKMKQADLADITNTSVKFISNVERGKKTAQLDKILDLIRALDLQIYVFDKPIEQDKANGPTFDFLG